MKFIATNFACLSLHPKSNVGVLYAIDGDLDICENISFKWAELRLKLYSSL